MWALWRTLIGYLSKAPTVRIKSIYFPGRKGKMTRSLLCLLAGLVLGFLLAVATKARAFNRLSAANRELASQLEAEKHQLELQKQLTEAATASIRLATGQLNECNQALHRATTRLRSQ